MKAPHLRQLFFIAFICLYIILNRTQSFAQSFYFGADLSYVNEMEDCGANYSVGGTAEDPYKIFSDHGANLFRIRLWHTPSWYDNLNQGKRYSDFQDVRHSIMRAKAEGMKVLLDFHLSDTWADPTHQVAPLAWTPVLGNVEILQDSLYNYIYSTLSSLAVDSLLPEIVQIGNETNKGILLSQEVNDAGWILEWPRNSLLFNSAISAIRDIENATSANIKIALHIADPDDVRWYIQQFWDHGVQDFDIIGISYYWQFHEVLLEDVGATITDLKADYPGKEVMIFETAYPWTTSNADGANNILYTSYPGYAPHGQGKQLQWMIDLTQDVIDHGGSGVVYWEPAWVSTGCWTQYGHGSHWENATFFDFNDALSEQGGIGWMTHPYEFTSSIKVQTDISDNIQVIQSDHEIIIRRISDSILNGQFEIEIYTVEGKKILNDLIIPYWQNNAFHITTPSIVPGIYLFRMITEDHLNINKLLFLK